MSSVTFLDAQRWYPGADAPAVPGLDLVVGDGEVVALLGPAGSGKSTVLRMLAGLEEVSRGRVLVGDRDVTSVPARERGVAVVFQNYALHPHLSVAENVGYALELVGVAEDERRARVEEAAALLGLTDLLDQRPEALSDGQRQRVALGRAVVRRPQVLCLDEPLSNLDLAMRARALSDLPGLLARVGVTTLVTTREPVEAAVLGHRVVELRDGRVQQRQR
ncbi:ABC transporter ATP-binding protein [Nocardioides sp. AX2bis]|uniref:ABC transporter ATP-binding protein n=1 Tax=Nocardioides sp. AX2bis TaxID=2653157 RepID=UPI0012F06643